MPRLLELQQAMHRSLVERDDREAASHIVPDGLAPGARLNVYRNAFIASLTKALRLCYPAIYRLVGAEFFAGAAARFIPACPPGKRVPRRLRQRVRGISRRLPAGSGPLLSSRGCPTRMGGLPRASCA